MAKRRAKSVFDVECVGCHKFLGSASSNKQASRILEVHQREDHGSRNVIGQPMTPERFIRSIFE